MTQDAVVLNTFNNGMAEVVVIRGTACGSNCGNCESCIYQNELHTTAKNTVNAVKGQHVEIESSTKEVYKAEFIIYIIPILLLIIGFIFATVLGASELIGALVGFVFLIVGAFIIVRTQKNKPGIAFEIVRILYD